MVDTNVLAIEVRLPYLDGVPSRDLAMHTYHFTVNSVFGGPSIADQCATLGTKLLTEFYNHRVTPAVGADRSIGSLHARFLNRAAATVRAYNVDLTTYPAAGSSVFVGEQAFPMDATDTDLAHTDLPAEVAFAMTTGSGDERVPLRSRHGRVYLGPWVAELNSSVLAEPPADYGRPNGLLRGTIRGAALNFFDSLGSDAITPNEWCIFSRKHKLLLPIQVIRDDDEWDTQRRRGMDPTNSVLTNLV